MKNIRGFYPNLFQFLEVKCSIYLNRRVFVMASLILHELFYLFLCARVYACVRESSHACVRVQARPLPPLFYI